MLSNANQFFSEDWKKNKHLLWLFLFYWYHFVGIVSLSFHFCFYLFNVFIYLATNFRLHLWRLAFSSHCSAGLSSVWTGTRHPSVTAQLDLGSQTQRIPSKAETSQVFFSSFSPHNSLMLQKTLVAEPQMLPPTSFCIRHFTSIYASFWAALAPLMDGLSQNFII